MTDPFASLPRRHFKAILADPPWRFEAWSGKGTARSADNHYSTMPIAAIAALPVADLIADDCVLFMWSCWPLLPEALRLIDAWGFTFKTCGFDWMKAKTRQIDMFRDDADVQVGMGYWTRANSEPCLLATKGKPKRLNADVRQGIIEPRREHSRKPECVHGRIERLVAEAGRSMIRRLALLISLHLGYRRQRIAREVRSADVKRGLSRLSHPIKERKR